MLIVKLNRNPNQEMMASRINEINERKIGLQVHLGIGDLCLGEDLRQGGVAFVEVRQKLAILGLRVHLGGELRDCTKMTFLPFFHRKFPTKTKPYQNKPQTQLKTTKNTYMEELRFANPNIDNEGVRRVS